jgi:hypothetical protein
MGHCWQSTRYLPSIESLEVRTVPADFVVITTDDGGPGSLRQAILDANATPEVDIMFLPGGYLLPELYRGRRRTGWRR